MLPVAESLWIVGGSSAWVDNQRKEEKGNGRNDLDTREDGLGFSVYPNGEDVQIDYGHHDHRDPCRPRRPNIG